MDCPALTVAAGAELTCTYTTSLAGKTDGTNTATATQQNYAYAADGTRAAAGTTDYSASAPVAFGEPTTVTDECVTLADTYAGSGLPDSLCATDLTDGVKAFTYARDVSYSAPGTYQVENTASFVTGDSKTPGSDSVTVPVQVISTPPGAR